VDYMRQQTDEAVKADKAKALQEEIDKMIALRESQDLPTFGATAKPPELGRGSGRSGSNLV
jgi:hypothetical protein